MEWAKCLFFRQCYGNKVWYVILFGKCNENLVKRNAKRNAGFSSENDVFLM